MKEFDAIIIGAGQAGPALAGRLTGAGMTVALVERKVFGGTCVNTGCTPIKTLIASADAPHLARRAADFGILLESPVRVDMKKVKARAAVPYDVLKRAVPIHPTVSELIPTMLGEMHPANERAKIFSRGQVA